MNLAFRVFLLILLIVFCSSLKGIGLNPIKPYHSNQGKSTSYLFMITPEEQILTKAKVSIAFPNQFDQSKIAANLQCMVKSDSYNWKTVPCTYQNSSVVIIIGQIKDQPTYIQVSQPLNPTIFSMSSYFSVCFMYDNTITTCNKQFGKVVFPNAPILNNGVAVPPQVSSLNSFVVGQASTYQFKFGLSANYSAGNTLRVKFPPGFTTTQSPICQMVGTYNQVIKTFVWPDKRSIQCQSINSSFVMNTPQFLKIIGIYNPIYAGNFGNTIQGFVVQILRNTTTISMEQIRPTAQISIITGTLQGRIEQQNNFIKSKTKYTFYLNLQNPLTSSNYIQIKFTNVWTLYSGQCSVISGLKLASTPLSCQNSTSGGFSYLTIKNFDSASVSNQIVFSILVGSPNTSGNYSVQTITGNSFGVMDKMTSQIVLNSTYGTIDMLSINAITANSKVAVGKTGPLQLTFFLNYQLPQTNVLTFGKFIMKIYPQIPAPNTGTNGVLKCYFYNDMPAKTCIWDVTNPSYTLVTINTPQTVSFQYSQIPITLTTEGAVNDSMIGITIADVVTRYRFELQAYKQDNITVPTEVFYTEYIADAIPLTLTTYSLTNEVSQSTHLRFQFIGPYDFVNSVVKDIRLKIQFLNSGWATNLGYQPNQIYKRFPCTFSQSTQNNPPTYNNKVICDLYTYTDGPHGSLTDSITKGPYIMVYGFYPQLYKNYNYRLELGKFLIGDITGIQNKVRFSIIQQTPDMLTKYIQLYYNQLALFTTTSGSASLTSNAFVTTMNSAKINYGSAVHTNAYTAPTGGFAIVYEYDQSSTQSFANANFLCSTSNWCVALGYPVNWIIQYKNSGSFTSSISSSFSFINGAYADTFTGKVRVFKSNMSILYKATFSYTYTPQPITSYSFALNDHYSVVYKNMEQYYLITFWLATALPSNGFFRFTLSSEMKFGMQPFCQTNITTYVLDKVLGLVCNLENSRSTLKIYNLGAIAAGTQVQIRVRIATQLGSAGSIGPTLTIQTFRTLSIDTSLVDRISNFLLSGSNVVNYYTNPTSFDLKHPRTLLQTPRVNYVGRFQIKLRPSTNSINTPANKIKVSFIDHPWNGGKFTTPNNAVTDPLVCKVNRKRVACTYTLNPFQITMNVQPAGLNGGNVDNFITLDTQYLVPFNGIKHPSAAGQYMTGLYFIDSSNNQLERTTFTHQVRASKLRNLQILSTCHDRGVQNMFRINFQTFSNLTVNANNDGTKYSRIFVEFPTVDSQGTKLFDSDLGGYSTSGQQVGCHFYWQTGTSYYVQAATNYMKCRLIKSEVLGEPVRVQIINHGAFTSSVRWMRVFIAKIFNPTVAVTSLPVSIRIQHITVATNDVEQVYYDTYDVFMNSQNPTLQTNSSRTARTNSFQASKDIGDQGMLQAQINKIGSVAIDTTIGYWWVMDLTQSFKPIHNQANPSITCSGTYFIGCYAFPEINYLVINAKSDGYTIYHDVRITPAISQNPTIFVARIWQNGRLMGFDSITFTANNWAEVVGAITGHKFDTLGNQNQRRLKRRRQQVRVQFYTDNGINAGGSIQVVFPSTFPKAYPHCRSMISQGSVLYAQNKNYNGQVGCMVQNTRNWVVTSFQAVGAGSKIVLVGQVDFPTSYPSGGWVGTRSIYTYNNSHYTDIRANGFVIDYLLNYQSQDSNDIAVQNEDSSNVDSQLSVQQTLSLRVGYVGPLQFKFQLNQNFIGSKNGRMIVRLWKKSTISQANGFSYVDKKYVCKIVELSTSIQTGCIVQKVQDDTNITYQNVKFTMFTSSDLSSASAYKLVLTTQQGMQPQGITFPTLPGTYKVSFHVDADSNTNYNIYNHMYLQVYGTSFSTLKIISFNTLPSRQNLIWVQLTPATQIQMTQQIVLQFPTRATGSPGMLLFSSTLGYSQDNLDIPVDVMDSAGDFANGFMKCRVFLGDSTYSKPAKIVCGQFLSAIATNKLLFFGIKITNPALDGRAQASLPIFVYSMQQGKTYKKNFNIYDNAVHLRSDLYTRNHAGSILGSNLQTSGSNIDLISRNIFDLIVGQYYLLFFNFPLRRNGKITNGCTNPINGNVYGHAYYHQNLWVIVCQVTTNGISSAYANNTNGVCSNGCGTNTRNLRISGFYTPWYYLSGTQIIVNTYSYHTGDITTMGTLTDNYPNVSPKAASSPTFTMTPVFQTGTMYAGSLDDYVFQIRFSSTANNDISYMRRIAIIFPDPSYEGNDYILEGQDCVEAIGSDVQIEECWIQNYYDGTKFVTTTGNGRVIWIRPVVKSTYTSDNKIRIQTRNLAIRNPTNNKTVNLNRFVVKFYSWENIPQPALSPLSNNIHSYLIMDSSTIPSQVISYAQNPGSYNVDSFDYINYPHQRYYQQTPYQTLIHRAPIQLKFRPDRTFTTQSSAYHNIKVYYPSSFGDYAKFKIRDLQVFRPVCYLANYRIKQCTIDTTNNFVSMNFMFGLTANTVYHIKVSLIDPRNQDMNGFLASTAITDLVLTYTLASTATVYYIQTDQFPTLYSLPTGISGGPFRGIIGGSVQYGHVVVNQLNSINMVLNFNRTDITGLVFQIPLKDTLGNYLYPTAANFAAAFLNLQNGATYPCGNNGFGAGGNPKCIILNGDNTLETVSTKIIMTDFTYNTKMNCRFIFRNPQTNLAYFSVMVKAYGGTRSENNLYGDKFMGEWNFIDIFQASSGISVGANTYTRSYYCQASKSPWRNGTTQCIKSRSQNFALGSMSLAQVLLYDSSASYTDKQICQVSLGSANDYDDLLQYTVVLSGVTKKWGYFVRTWQGASNIYHTNGDWVISNLKCKLYTQSFMAYHFFSKTSIEKATNAYSNQYAGGLSGVQAASVVFTSVQGSITSPTIMYFDQNRRFSDSTVTAFVMQIDFTATFTSLTNFQFRSRDQMVLLITINTVFGSNTLYWNAIQSCQLLGGIISTSQQKPAFCEYHSANQIRIRNIAGFQTDPLLASTKNKRVKFLFKVDRLVSQQSASPNHVKYTQTSFYANYDALSNSLQPIFYTTSTTLNSCQHPLATSSCWHAYGAGSDGLFQLHSISDTSLRVSFKPGQTRSYGGSTSWDHFWKLDFNGFGFGACTITDIVAQLSTSTTPGSGTNSTLPFVGVTCSDHLIQFAWQQDRTWASNFGLLGLGSAGDFNMAWYINFYITIAPSNQDLPVMHHDYIWMTGSYTINDYPSSTSYQNQIAITRGVSYLPIQSLASTSSVTTLTTTRQAVTQLIIEVKSLNLDIGSTKSNYILLAQFLSQAWTGSNDPFASYTNTLKSKQKIQCKCLSGVGPLSSSTTSPYVDAKCYRRFPINLGSGTFTNYAITIDHPADKTQDIKCYFPQFFVKSGMSFQVQMKAIYGDSYPIDLIGGTNKYGSMYTSTTPLLDLTGTTPNMGVSYTNGWNSLSDNLYTSAVTVGSKFSGIYVLSGDWGASLTSPYIYINFQQAGPVPVSSFCSDANVYFQCRVYSKLINVVVAKFKSSSVQSFSMTQGAMDLYYPPSQSSDNTFNGFLYVGTTYWQRTTTLGRTKSNLAPISNNKLVVYSDKYGSSRYNYNTNILIAMSISGKTLYDYQQTGSKIQILFTGITHKSNCQVWVQNQMSIQLTCKVTTGVITIYSSRFDFSTTNNIFVSLGILNPNIASVTFTMNMYSYWYSASRFLLVISRTAIYSTDLTYASNTKLDKSRVVLYPFKSRISMVSNSPLRVQFSIPASPGSITWAANGLLKLVNSHFAYTTDYLTYIKQYTSLNNMMQQTQYTMYYPPSYTISGSTLDIRPPKTITINPSYFYELVVMPIGISAAGCAVAGYGCFNQAGFHQTNFEDINFIAYKDASNNPAAQKYTKRYAYQGSTKIGLQYIYYLCAQPSLQTSIYVLFNIDFNSVNNFPSHYIQLTFFDLLESSFVGYSFNDVIPCQLSDNFLNITTPSRKPAQCKLATPDAATNYVKIRIQNIGNLAVGNYWVSLDDIVLPSYTAGDATKKFDLSIGYYAPATNVKYENIFREIFVMDGTNATNPTTVTGLAFENPTPTTFGAPVSTKLSFTWPFDTSSSDIQSKISLNINGGYAASWADINTLTFTDATLGTYQLLWVNKKLNKFVFKIPNKSSGSSTIVINNVRNPYPYQKQKYNTNTNIQMNVYNNYYSQATRTISQVAFTYFQKNPSIIYINQNLPSNTIDNYPTNEKITLNGLTKLTLSVAFDQVDANTILRQLNIIDIKFTSGLNYIDECRATRNNTLYVNTLTTCQTYYDGTYWHVKLYDVTGSQLSPDWWVHVFATFNLATLAYTFQIMPKNLEVQYQSLYSLTIQYDATKIIPTQLSWLNRKYVRYYFENQVKMIQAVTGAQTKTFKFRFNSPIGFDGPSDWMLIYLQGISGVTQPFRSKNQASNLMCLFLPALSAERDFSVGYYSQCTLDTTANPYRYKVEYIHGGLPQGDYLFQLMQRNIINTAFNYPQSPARTLITLQSYRSQDNGYREDAFYIQSYRYFTKAQIVHTTTTVGQYDTLKITYIPQGALAAGSTNRQIVLRLSVNARYHDTQDGGIKSIYLADGTTIYSGHRYSQVLSGGTATGNQLTTLQFSQYANNYAPLRFNLALQSAYVDGTTYVWRVPLLKNPLNPFIALRYNLTLLEYPSTATYGVVFNHYQIINDYFTQSDTSVVFTSSVTNSLRDVQTTSGVDLSINLNGQNLAQWDSVTFKLDNSLKGLTPSFSNCNDTTNYDYYYFHTINMVFAQKKSTNNISTVGINALSTSQDYQSTFALKWVKLFNSSSTKQRFNPVTMKTSVPPTLTLTPFTTYSTKGITLVQGFQKVGSIVLYKLSAVVKKIPLGGQVRITFDETKFTTNIIGNCRVRSGFSATSTATNPQASLRCYRGLNGFIVTGFNTIATLSTIQIYFYVKSLVIVTNSDFSLDIFGVFRDNSTRISNAVAQQISHSNSTFSTNLERILQSVTHYYRSFDSWYNQFYYYELQGSFILRATNLAGSSQGLALTYPGLGLTGYRRLLIKQNSSTVTGWTQMTESSCAGNAYGTRCVYYLPPNYGTGNDLTLMVGNQYIWRYSTIYYNAFNGSRQNGFYFELSGTHRFILQGLSPSVTQVGYKQFIPKYRPIAYTLLNKYPAAGRQTLLDITFTLWIDLATSDQIQLTFDSNNLLYNMFQIDLQGNPAINQTYRYLDCRQYGSGNNISTVRTTCLLYFGDRTVDPPKPARLSIKTNRGFDGYPYSANIRFLVANVRNPSTQNMNVGVQLNINRYCYNVNNQTCPYHTSRHFYVTTAAAQNSPAANATWSSNGMTVLQSSQTHTFTIPLTAQLNSNGIIYIIYPQNYQGVMPSDCTADNSFTCFSFPTRRWIVLYPGSTYSSSVTINIWYMTNGYYSQALDPRFKITVARPSTSADVFYVTPTALTPQTSGYSMTITATQTPQIWLRNYANTAIFVINSIFDDDRIKAIYIKAPSSDVTSWTDVYCNASITGTQINTYPLRFICKVDQTDPSFLKITRHSEQDVWGSWQSLAIKVHAKFTLTAFSAGQPILYTTLPVTSNAFFAYGSVNPNSPSSKYYKTQTSQTVSISQHQVPIISEITFNQKSFAGRTAKVTTKQVFYLLLRPTVGTSRTIAQIVFKVPDEFNYPGVFSHDNCYMLGRTKQPQAHCKQSRQAGQTLLKLRPTNYNQEVKIIQLGSVSNSSMFTAPSLPGDFYNMTVQIYDAGNVLLEKETINISPVKGEFFNIPDMSLNNIRETNYAESVYDFVFKTGTLQIPPGAPTTSTQLTSQIQFIFENYNAANATNVFNNDLRTSLKQGDEVGCVIRSGITALQNKRLKCLLHIGTNSTDKPMIRIINYGFINPNTTIDISFAAIQSLMATLTNTISIGVKLFYNNAKNSTAFLYIPTAILPLSTYATSLDATRISHWDWYFATAYSGTNVVLQPTSFSVSIRVPYYGNYAGYQYASSGALDQYTLIKFSPKFLIDPYNVVNITCSQCSNVQIFYATGIIRFKHTYNMQGSGTYTFNFNNFPTSSYAITNYNLSVIVQMYKNYRRQVQSPTMYLLRTVEKCTKFDFGVVSVSSLNGGQIDVEYLFSIKTNHYIPPNGAISISLPSSYGNMVANGGVCTLTGFQDTNAYCSIDTPNRIDIYLNGSQLSQSYSYKINVKGLQNPNVASSNLSFIVTSYFQKNIYNAKIICENKITPPAINVKALRDCTLQWQPDFSNMFYNATYSFYVSCSDQFRGSSIVYFKLPSEFSTRNSEGDKVCSSYESTTLINSTCTLKYINGSLLLYAYLDAASRSSFSIITNFINPINNTYKASAFIMSKGVNYAAAPEESLTILSNTYVTAGSNDVFLMNNPKQGGLMSTYIFKILPVTTFSPQNLAFVFPNNFNLVQTQLNIGIAVTDVSNLFEQLNYDNIQKIINNVSKVGSVSLKLYPSFSVSGNTIFIKNITNQLSNSLWTYVLIRGIKNPSSYRALNFTVAYYQETVQYKSLKWIYKYPLKYFISPPPNYLTIQKVQVSDYDLLYPSTYKFTISSSDGNKVAVAGKKLSYVLVLPTFYKSTLWANTAPVCKFDNLATTSTCYSYESEIIVTQLFAADATRLVLSISTILNPSLQTYCNTTDVTLLSNTFFKIRIIEVESNAFLFQSSAVVDSSNCLKFTSLRIPITLQYSLIMVAGLTYNITYGLTRPASNLKINAYIQNQTGFTFSPSMVQFNDYYTLRNSTTLYLRSDIPAGKYTIKFNKYESQQKTYFRNILPITITVIKADQTSLARPTIGINSMTVSTVGYAVQIPVLFSMPSSTQMTLFMSIAQQTNTTLEQYNSAFKDISITPRIINIKPQQSNYSFKIQHMQRKVPPPLTLSFKLTSLYPIIHNLTTEKLYLCFDQDPKFDVLEPPLRIRITPFIQSCNAKDIGKSITNIFAPNTSSSQNKTVNSVLPVIVSVDVKTISSTRANLQVSLDSGATVYYICLPSGYPAIADKATIKTMNSTIGFTGKTSSNVMSIYSGTTSQINYKAQISLSKLFPTSDYDIYVLSQSTLGQSSIFKKSFKTSDISKGVVMKISFKDIVDSLTIVKALQRILRISPIRIKVLTSIYQLQLLKNTITTDKNNPYYVYQVVIAPDPTNDIKSPETIATEFISSTSSKQQFKTQVPLWADLAPITYYQLRVVKPKVLQMPKPIAIFNYNCTFSIKMWQKANIYAVLIKQQGKVQNTLKIVQQAIVPVRVQTLDANTRAKVPSSNQIRSGLDKKNIKLNKYSYYSGTTDVNGSAKIFFDDLMPGTKYSIYITSSSILPYEPTYLWQDGQVIKLSFSTLYNQALHNQQINTEELKKYNPGLASAIQKFLKNNQNKNNMRKLEQVQGQRQIENEQVVEQK